MSHLIRSLETDLILICGFFLLGLVGSLVVLFICAKALFDPNKWSDEEWKNG